MVDRAAIMAPPRLALALASCALSLLGCGSTLRPVEPTRAWTSAHRVQIDSMRINTMSASFDVRLQTRLPDTTQLQELVLVDARGNPCTERGLRADWIDVDDVTMPDLSADVSGSRRIVARFGEGLREVANHPVALEFRGKLDQRAFCDRVPFVDSEPAHAWENDAHWSLGWGVDMGVAASGAVGIVTRSGMTVRARYALSPWQAVSALAGVESLACRRVDCGSNEEDGLNGGTGIPLGLGYHQTLLWVSTFAMGIGAQYTSHVAWMPRLTGTDFTLYHDLSLVPRIALAELRRTPAGLPGNSLHTAIELEVPVGLWLREDMTAPTLVVGGSLVLSLGL